MIVESSPLVSVVTSCFNDGKYIRETVDSVAASSYKNVEHIIIDDGSTDQTTKETLLQLQQEGYKVYFQENRGVCAARNFGVGKAIGKYLLFVDADDLISKTFIEEAVYKIEEDPQVIHVSCNYELFGKTNRKIIPPRFTREILLCRNIFVISSLIKKVDFIKVGGFRENMKKGLEDWDLWLSFAEINGTFIQLPEVHFYYRIKKISRNSKIKQDHVELRRILWENHKQLFSQYFFNPLGTFEYLLISESKEYKLGLKILTPVRFLAKKLGL